MKPKVALGLKDLTDQEKITKALQIANSMTANATIYGTSDPTAAEITTAANSAQSAVTAKKAADLAAQSATTTKNVALEALENILNSAAGWAENANLTKEQLELVFTLQKERERTTELGVPGSLTSTYGDNPGTFDLQWNPVAKAVSYLVQVREVGGEWRIATAVGSSTAKVEGLTPGTVYQMRVCAIGPNKLQGPWSDITERRAP